MPMASVISNEPKKNISFFTECGDSSYSGPNDRAQITKTICNVVRCFAFLHQFAHQRIVWPPALLACRPNFILLFLIIIGTSWKFQIYKQRNWCYWRRLTYQWCCWRHCCQRLSVTQIGHWGKICRWTPGRSSLGGRCPCHDGLGLLDGALPCSQVRTSPQSKVSFPNPLVHFLSPHCSMLRHHTSRAPSLSPTPLPGRYLCVCLIS